MTFGETGELGMTFGEAGDSAALESRESMEQTQREAQRQALAGVKVLDFSWAVAGPMTTKTLAVHGATVVKVESNLRLDGPRVAPPFRGKPGRNNSAYYTDINTSKYSITLNMTRPEGIDVAKRLVAWADIVAENFSPGVMGRWGLAYPDLKRIKPDIIMISSSMQGAAGPNATHPGLGQTLGALVGINHFTGWPDREPLGLAIPYTDVISPWFAATALLAALEHRDRTGEGQWIDVSQFETAVHMLAPAFIDYAANGRIQQRVGNRSPYWSPHGVYRCKGDSPQGDWVAIAVTSDEEWEGFRRAIGASGEGWTRDERFETTLGRVRHAGDLDALVEQWTVDLTPDEAVERLQAERVPSSVVATARELHADPQLAHIGQFVQVDHPRIGPHAHTHPAFWLSETPAAFRPGALIGEHNELVYKTFIDMPDDEYARLADDGVFQ